LIITEIYGLRHKNKSCILSPNEISDLEHECMRQKIIAGNWKMNGQITTVTSLVQDLRQMESIWLSSSVTAILFPPYVYLPLVASLLEHSAYHLGAQNVYPKDSGAFTGEVSAPMLRDVGCQYVLVGHSERRHGFGESEKIIADKFHHVKEHGMIPVLCVGETLEEYEQGLTQQVIEHQLNTVFKENASGFSGGVIAYEPVWAIGTGRTATPEQAEAVHRFIRTWLSGLSASLATETSILYGGSVNDKNAKALLAMPDIDGALVGGASLNAQQFVDILKCIN
jgi:triosephosphate isomerase